MNIKTLTKNRMVKLFADTFAQWMEDKALRLAAALAYYSVFSIAPIMVIAMGVAGLVWGVEAVQGQLKEQMQSVVGARAAEAVQTLVQSASKPEEGWMTAVTGFVALIFGASAFFAQLKDALNTIWGVKIKEGAGIKALIRERLLSFGMVLVIGFLLLVSLLMTTAISALNKHLGSIVGIPAEVWAAVAFFISMGMVATLFALIFKILPDAKVRWRHVWIGAVVTAVLFEIGKFGLGLYLGRESTASSYGAAASVVLLLLWVYYASCILLFGAEFTQVYARSTEHAIMPGKNAEAITTDERAHQGLTPDSKPNVAPEVGPMQTAGVPAAEPGRALEPAGALLLTTAAAFVAGLILRHWEEKPRR